MAKAKRKLSAYNQHVKREMKAGKSMKQAAASWKGRGSKTKAAKKPKSKRSSSKGGKSKVSKSGFNTTKIFKYVRLAALAMPAAIRVMGPGSVQDKAASLSRAYTGFDPNTGTFNWSHLAQGWLPFLGATVVTYGIPKVAGMIRSV